MAKTVIIFGRKRSLLTCGFCGSRDGTDPNRSSPTGLAEGQGAARGGPAMCALTLQQPWRDQDALLGRRIDVATSGLSAHARPSLRRCAAVPPDPTCFLDEPGP
jgi:hypothetical protein